MPLLAVVANKSLWPLWALISLGGVVFPFLLCPVYINFISRMQLAWSLDRQMPEWFGQVNERLRGPLNAIIATLVLTASSCSSRATRTCRRSSPRPATS